MAKVVKVPVLGQSVEEVRIVQWYKNEGDTVAVGERLAEIETDKTNMDFESTEAGVVRRLLAPVDAFVKVEAPIVIIGDATESIDDVLSGASGGTTAPTPTASAPITTAPAQETPATPISDAELFISPRARRVADEFSIAFADLAGRGTGPNGRVQEKDVIAFHEEQEALRAAEALADRGPKASPLARAVASAKDWT